MKNILVPYELDIDNKANLKATIKLATGFGAIIKIIHSFVFDVDEEVSKEKVQSRLLERKYEIIEDIEKQLKGTSFDKEAWRKTIKLHVVYGKIQEEILNEVENYDLISFTLPFKKNDHIALNGKKINFILNKIKVPSLLIPDNLPHFKLENIIYCTNLLRIKKSDSFIVTANEIAKKFDSSIHFLHVSEKKTEIISEIEDIVTYQKMKSLTELNPDKYEFSRLIGKEILKAVKGFAQDKNTPLIIAIRQNRNFFESFFHDSFTNNIGLFIKEPILIFHEK